MSIMCRNLGGSLTFFMQHHHSTDCMNNGDQNLRTSTYQSVTRWATIGDGFEYGEVDLLGFSGLALNRIFAMGFVDLRPAWNDLYFFQLGLSSDYIRNCPNNCNNRGTCNFDGSCSCNSGYYGSDCGLVVCPGVSKNIKNIWRVLQLNFNLEWKLLWSREL